MPDPSPDIERRARRPSRRLPDALALQWAASVGELPWGSVHPSPSAALRLRAVLQAHAAELVPRILGGGRVDANGILHAVVTRYTCTVDGRFGRVNPVDVGVTVDLRAGGWRTSQLDGGDDVLSLARWCWHGPAMPGRAGELAAEERLLAHLGLAALDVLAASGGRPVPILPALVTPARPRRSAQAHVWCPWCEDLHSHSAGPGPRVAHCSDKASPYRATGYVLDIVGKASTAEAVMPAGPLIGRSRFKSTLEALTPRLQAALLRRVVGQLRRSRARLHQVGDAWMIDLDPAAADGGGQLAGVGLLDLVAVVWGVTRGVVIVRLIEALQGWKLDAMARAALADAVDAATSRPSPVTGGAA